MRFRSKFRIATWSCRHNLNLHRGEEVSKKKSSKCFNLNQPALLLPQINFSFFAMALNDVPGLLLPVSWHDLTQVISLQTSGSCGPAVSVSGRWPGPRAHLASLLVAESRSEQNTDDKLKAYLTDIMWTMTRSL